MYGNSTFPFHLLFIYQALTTTIENSLNHVLLSVALIPCPLFKLFCSSCFGWFWACWGSLVVAQGGLASGRIRWIHLVLSIFRQFSLFFQFLSILHGFCLFFVRSYLLFVSFPESSSGFTYSSPAFAQFLVGFVGSLSILRGFSLFFVGLCQFFVSFVDSLSIFAYFVGFFVVKNQEQLS